MQHTGAMQDDRASGGSPDPAAGAVRPRAAFLSEPEPPRGVATRLAPGLRRLVARNAGPMTYHGTNTYLIEPPITDPGSGLVVLDPGPDDGRHVAELLAAAGAPVARILLSHTHADHLGAVAALRAATGAPVAAFHRSAKPGFAADLALRDGDRVAGLLAIHTPGHAADHLCFAAPGGVLFSADHVMGWSSSVVSPPRGDMAAYVGSLERLLARDEQLYHPGHGPAVASPRKLVEGMIRHRLKREAEVARRLEEAGPSSIEGLVDALYSQTDPMLRRAAGRNVLAHLIKLEREGRVRRSGDRWQWRDAA